MPDLGDFFGHEVDEETYGFTLSRLTPSCGNQDLVEVLAGVLSRAKSDPRVTADLLKAVGWRPAMADLWPGEVAVRRGDFAEAIAAEACEKIDGRNVPIRKLRYQIDPNQTLPGGDVVSFQIEEAGGTVEDLEFIEVKYRTNPRSDIAVDAHEQLACERNQAYATTIKFLANRLKESDWALYSQFMAHLQERGTQDSWHTLVLVYEAENWSDSISDNLHDLPKLLPALWLRLVPLEGAVELIDAVYAELFRKAGDDE